MIDLHVHTNYSDGTWNLSRVLEEAQKANINILSITDHDTIKAYTELKNMDLKKIYDGKIVTGVEFSTVYDGVAFHMLAYDFECEKLKNFIHENYENKNPNLNEEFDYMVKSCRKNNVKLGNISYDENLGWPVDIVFEEIKRYEENKKFFKEIEWNNVDMFFNSCVTNKNFPAAVDFSIHYPDAKMVSDAVRNAGGKVFIAHLYRYNLEKPFEFLDLLKKNKIIDGVEVEHSAFEKEQCDSLIQYCKENNLLMSGGTDCHGDKKASRKIGIGYGNMNVSESLIDNWIS